jgi:hypothetical protein
MFPRRAMILMDCGLLFTIAMAQNRWSAGKVNEWYAKQD